MFYPITLKNLSEEEEKDIFFYNCKNITKEVKTFINPDCITVKKGELIIGNSDVKPIIKLITY